MKTGQTVKTILQSGDIDRFHAVPGIKNQRLSDHLWKTTIIFKYLMPEASPNAILACMTRDCAELVTGDIPFIVKKQNTALKGILKTLEQSFEKDNGLLLEITENERYAIKIADMVEGLLYCTDRWENFREKEADITCNRWFNEIRSYLDDPKAHGFNVSEVFTNSMTRRLSELMPKRAVITDACVSP